MKKVVDYLGNEFESVRAMCRAYGIEYNKYVATARSIKNNVKNKTTTKGKPRGKGSRTVTLSDGRTFKSVKEAANALGVSYGAVICRINKMGWDIERALTTPKKDTMLPISCTDGTNQYNSLAEMANALGVSKHKIYQRHHRGKSLLEEKTYTDHLGNVYSTKSAMCEAYGITVNILNGRIASGYTLEEALTGNYDTSWTCFDHLGNKFKSIHEMCKAHHIKFDTFRARKRKGYSLEQCLSNDFNLGKRCYDHLGIEYRTIKEMCEKYKVKRTTFENRMRNGMSLEQALTKKGV